MNKLTLPPTFKLMRAYYLAPAAAALLLAATACEKIITPKLNTSPAQLVIEGNLADDGQPCRVSVAQSTDYTNTNSFPAVTGATVTLSDDAGNREVLRESPAGQYVGSGLRGVPGRTYTLRVQTGSGTYVATARLPAPVVPFDRLSTQASTFGSTRNVQAVVEFVDPPGPGNSYVFRQYRNGVLNPTIFLQNDQFVDGNRVSQVLRSMGGSTTDANRLQAGDSLRVEMQNVDPGAYEYFRTLNQIITSTAAPTTTPANPTSNFSGGALGYFSAYSRRFRAIKVP